MYLLSNKILKITLLMFIYLNSLPSAFAETTIKSGCEYSTSLSPLKYSKPFVKAPEISSENGKLNTTLAVNYGDHTIAGCNTRLRGYNGKLVGPTLRLKPGDNLKVLLKNELPKKGNHDHKPDTDINIPHNFNTTNFHTHGLHVSPKAHSDNVLKEVQPQEDWQININIPTDHPTGTFWYHPHVHGSTALQVSSGMGGTIIIENDNDPHSLDSIAEIKAAKEDIFMLQQIVYDEQGKINDYENFSPGSWKKTGRLPTVNGQIMPVITMQPGEVRRWRLIHGGIRETFMVTVSAAEDSKPWLLHEIAVDGLSLGYINKWQKIELQPGYRSDILVKAPLLTAGETKMEYYVFDSPTGKEKSLHGMAESQQIIAKVIVEGAVKDMPLPKSDALAMTKAHKNIQPTELTGKPQNVEFNIANNLLCPIAGEPCQPCTDKEKKEKDECGKFRFMINKIPFAENNIRNLKLGTASEWTLNSTLANHPFHIHVNPFQSVRKNPQGHDEIVWRDTLLVKKDQPIKIQSRYTRYTGKFVLHCHILDHEDQGMMQIVDIIN